LLVPADGDAECRHRHNAHIWQVRVRASVSNAA
jgi:hypothetical protein